MAWASKSYTFSASTTARAAEVNDNFDDMVDQLNVAAPSGIISMWSGSVGSIPSGWYLCDGNNSTPDLRGKFVLGAGGAYAVGASGGAETHDHGGATGVPSSDLQYVNLGDENEPINGNTHSHSISSASSLPPYYALCFVMKS